MIYPISFCFPDRRIRPLTSIKSQEVSKIIPGEPYSFSDQDEYMDEYASSKYAITKKKAGYDCMRHLEIMAAGSVPLFEDYWTIPKFTMTHYNKELFAKEKEATPEEWREHFKNHLTSTAMVKYICNSLMIENPKKVLFMDITLPIMPDYLSIGLYYGCKELFGENMDVLEEVPYAFTDYEGDVSKLYGRGFNYTKLCSPDEKCKTNMELISKRLFEKYYDLVIFPSIIRGNNINNFQEVIRSGFPTEKIALVIGEDEPFSKWKEYPVVSAFANDYNLFVRELD